MLTLISKNNLAFTKPKCKCGLSVNKPSKYKTRQNRKLKTRKNKTKNRN